MIMRLSKITGIFLLLTSLGVGSRAHAENPDGLSFSSLSALIESNQIDSIDALLPLLPVKFRTGYTLVYQSRSPQQGKESHPRAIVYGTTANFILTFNGAVNQRGFNRLETAEFDSQKKQYNFRELIFKDGQKPTPSELNPVECLGCHISQRPIWDNYPVYPGVYGVQKTIQAHSKDDSDLRDFIGNTLGTHSRYASLLGLGVFAKSTADGSLSYLPVSEISREDSYSMKSPGTGDLESQASGLSQLLLWHRYETLAAELKAHPKYDQLKWPLLAELSGCSTIAPVERYLPDPLNDALASHQKDFDHLLEESRRDLRSYLSSRHARLKFRDSTQADDFGDPDEWKEEIGSTWLQARYVLEAFGIDLTSYTMTFEVSDSFGAGQSHTQFLASMIYDDLPGTKAELGVIERRPVLDGGSGPIGSVLVPQNLQRFCDVIRMKSLGVLGGSN